MTELFTKMSKLWERVEHLQSNNSIYQDFEEIKYYEIDLDSVGTPVDIPNK